MKVLIATMFLLLFYVLPCSADKISSAFGLSLGEVFNLSSVIGKYEPGGATRYKFSSTNPYRSFNEYYVMVTPVTHVIYSISSNGTLGSESKCKKEQAVITEILKAKYAEDCIKDIRYPMFMQEGIFDQGDRVVFSYCAGEVLEIVYEDRELKKQAVTEEANVRMKNENTSGL